MIKPGLRAEESSFQTERKPLENGLCGPLACVFDGRALFGRA